MKIKEIGTGIALILFGLLFKNFAWRNTVKVNVETDSISIKFDTFELVED